MSLKRITGSKLNLVECIVTHFFGVLQFFLNGLMVKVMAFHARDTRGPTPAEGTSVSYHFIKTITIT